MRSDLANKRASNSQLRDKADSVSSTVFQLRQAVNQLNSDMDSLQTANDEDIKRLEEKRLRNEQTIDELREKLSDVDHNHNNIKIIIECTKNEIYYLSSEKEKHQSQNYHKRIDDFTRNIEDSQDKSQFLANELTRMTQEWTRRLEIVTKYTEEAIESNQHAEHTRIINGLIKDLEYKQSEIESLKKRIEQLLKEVSDEDSSMKDERSENIKQDLKQVYNTFCITLAEKNNIYDDLVRNTRELLDTDFEIQANSQEIAKLTQEYGIIRKELEQKEKIIHDLKIQLQEKRREVVDLKQLIEELQATLREREEEAKRLRNLAADKEAQIKALQQRLQQQLQSLDRPQTSEIEADQISVYESEQEPETETEPEPEQESELESQQDLEQDNEQEEIPLPDKLSIEIKDDVDAMLAEFIDIAGCPVPIKRLGGGYYYFGTKKIFAKIMNGKLVIRVGGGYMSIEEFIKNYAKAELIKVNKRKQKGLDIFTGKAIVDDEKSQKTNKSPKGRKSPNGKTINGTDCPIQLTAEDIKKYQED